MLVFYGFKVSRSGRDLGGCSFSIVLKLSVLSGISGGARFLWLHTFRFERDLWGCSLSIVLMLSVLSGISGGARFIEL